MEGRGGTGSGEDELMPGYERCLRLVADGFGTALLGATVVGSNIMVEITTRDAALSPLRNTWRQHRQARALCAPANIGQMEAAASSLSEAS